MAENRVYEMMYIAQPETTGEDLEKLNEAIEKLVNQEGGTVAKVENMGLRQLAYRIDKKTEGHYVLFEIEGSGKEIAELERRMRVNDAIMRYLTVRVDEDRKAADKVRAKRDKRRSERRSRQFDNQSAAADESKDEG